MAGCLGGAIIPMSENPLRTKITVRSFTYLRSLVARTSLRWLMAGACAPLAALATESGTTAFPNGGEDFLVAAMPPPGWYGFVYFNHYRADRLADNGGRMAVPQFKFKADVVAWRLDWVKPASILGADR